MYVLVLYIAGRGLIVLYIIWSLEIFHQNIRHGVIGTKRTSYITVFQVRM